MAPRKRQRAPARKTGPPKKRSKKDVSDESEPGADSEDHEKVREFSGFSLMFGFVASPPLT